MSCNHNWKLLYKFDKKTGRFGQYICFFCKSTKQRRLTIEKNMSEL